MKKLLITLVIGLFGFGSIAQSLYTPGGTLGNNSVFRLYPSNNAGANGALKLHIMPATNATVFQANSDFVWANHDLIFNAANTSGGNTDQLVVHRSGNVGIGTANPISWFGGKALEIAGNRPVLKLNSNTTSNISTILLSNEGVNTTTRNGEFHLNHVYDAANASNSGLKFFTYPAGEMLTLLSNGNIGVSLAAPAYKLDVGGTLRTSDYILGSQYISVIKSGSYRVSMNGQSHGYITGRNDSSQEKFLINSSGNTYFNGGNVGIGTTSPDQALTVKGKIHAEEVIIDLSVPAPDYVFEQNYPLTPLDEVQAYIAQHKHLPEVPSAKEMERDGVKVGEMEMILLKKIEEITLHLIELKNRNDIQSQQIIKMQTELDQFKKK